MNNGSQQGYQLTNTPKQTTISDKVKTLFERCTDIDTEIKELYARFELVLIDNSPTEEGEASEEKIKSVDNNLLVTLNNLVVRLNSIASELRSLRAACIL
jgi:hypothetical protein